jgi:hypothetical protein
MLMPRIDWLLQAAGRAGLELHPSLLYEKTIG